MGKQVEEMSATRFYRLTYANGAPSRAFLLIEMGDDNCHIREAGSYRRLTLPTKSLTTGATIEEVEPHEIEMDTTAGAAWWMSAYLEKHRGLEQGFAAHYLKKHFGPEFVRDTDEGGLSIIARVRRKLNEIHAPDYDTKHKSWIHPKES